MKTKFIDDLLELLKKHGYKSENILSLRINILSPMHVPEIQIEYFDMEGNHEEVS